MRNSLSVNNARAAIVTSTRSAFANVDDTEEPLTAALPFYPRRANRASVTLQFRYSTTSLEPAQRCQQFLHVRRQRAFEAQVFAGDRVLEPQHRRMQRLARKRRHNT